MKRTVIIALFFILMFVGIGFAATNIFPSQKLILTSAVINDNSEVIPEVWFQDSNGGDGSAGFLSDYAELFNNSNSWSKSIQYVSVFQFHTYAFDNPEQGVNNAFLKNKIIPLLKRNGIRIALNVTGANFSQCGSRSDLIQRDERIINQIKDAGGEVKYLSLQSTLSRSENNSSQFQSPCQNYTEDMRIDDVVNYIKYMRNKFPNIKIGLIDADPTQLDPYKEQMQQLKAALDEEGEKLDYYILDSTQKYLEKHSTDELEELMAFMRNDMKLRFGAIFHGGNDTESSNEGFRDGVMNGLRKIQKDGLIFDIYQLSSSSQYPTNYLPENSTSDYPFTKILLEFGKKVFKGRFTKDSNTIVGRLGAITWSGDVKGWAYNTSNTSQQLTISFYVNGKKGEGIYAGSTTTSGTNHRFNFSLPKRFMDNKYHKLYIYAGTSSSQVTNVRLVGSPVLIDVSPQ